MPCYAQNEHVYKQLSQTYLVQQFPYTCKIPVSNPLMRFQDSILVDIYYYQSYYDSKYQLANKQDTTTFVEYCFRQEGWYQIFVFTKQGMKLYQTSVLLMYKPKEKQTGNQRSASKNIQFEWHSEAIVFQNDSTIMVSKKKRTYEFDVYCTLSDILSDTLYVNVYKTEKKDEEMLFCQWKMVKSNDRYYTHWIIKRKEINKYRLSVFDNRKFWYGSKEVELQESR
jgi:hypothetical protein